MPDARRPLGRILTFYSYKGGTGRSMALANIAWILASSGRTVLMIDWDLEAPGLHRYFRPFLLDEELTASDGLIDLIDRYATAAIQPVDRAHPPKADWWLEYADFSDYVLSIDYDHFGSSGRLDFLPAGRQGDAYGLKVSSFNWQNLYDRLGGGAFFEAFKRRAREEYDYVLIDSRTGVSDTAGICSVQMPDTLVVCFTYNNQSIKGAAGVAQWARGRREQLLREMRSEAIAASAVQGVIEDSPRPYRVFAVPMRVDAGESDRLALRQAFARTAFQPMLGHLGADLAGYWSEVEVPYNVFYAYEEVLAAFKDKPSDPKTVLSAFVRMTSYITDRDVADYRLTIAPDEQQRFIEAFAVTAGAATAKPSSAVAETEDEILVRTAEAAFASLGDEQRAIAQRVFGRLVRIGRDEEGGGLSPIRAAIGDFNDEERSVIALLEKHGVLSVSTLPQVYGTSTYGSSGRPGGRTVGFANEKLLRLSKTIIGWIEGDREFLLWRQQLRSYVSDWERSDRKAPAVLGGTLFKEASYWFERRNRDLNAAETDFIWAASATLQEDVKAPPRATFKPRPQGAPSPIDEPTTLSAGTATLSSRLPLWLGVAAGLVLAVGIGWLSLGRSAAPVGVQPAGTVRDAVIVAAASAASDPLQRALLLLELGPSADAPSNARDLAIDLATTTLPWALLPNDAHAITVGRFGADGNSFATGSADGTVKVWRSGQQPVALTTSVGATVSIALDSRRGQLFVTGRNQFAEVWDLESRQVVKRLRIASTILDGTMNDGVPIVIQPVGTGRGGTTYIARFKGQRAEEYRAADFSTVATLLPGTSAVRFNASGEWGAAVRGPTINVWQLAGGRLLRSIEADSVGSIVFSPNGAYLGYERPAGISVVSLSAGEPAAGGARAEAMRRLEQARAEEQRRLDADRAPARPSPVTLSNAPSDSSPPLAVSPDGQIVVITMADYTALLMPSAELNLARAASPAANDLRWLRGHRGPIVDVDFSIDGSLVATAGIDDSSRLWRNPVGRPAPVRPPSSSSWAELWKTLRDRTTACLSADERMRLLNQPESEAQAAAGKCDADYGGKVFAAPVQGS